MNAAVLTISDGVHHGTREDRSGDTLTELLETDGFAVERRIVPDERDEIAEAIADLAAPKLGCVDNRRHRVFAARRDSRGDSGRCSTGRRPDLGGDPRGCARPEHPRDALRGLAGLRGATLIVNMPGLARRLPGRLRRVQLALVARARAGRPETSARKHTSRHEHDRTLAAAPLRLARQVRAHRLRAAVRLRRGVPRRRRLPGHRRPGLADARDDRRPHAGDGAQPARRRRARRPQPAHGRARDPGRSADHGRRCGRSAPRRSRSTSSPPSSSSRSCAGSGRSRSSMFVVYPYLKRVTWLCHLWLGACTGLAPLGAWLAVTGSAPWEAWALFAAQGLWVAGFDLFYSLFDLDARPGRRACARGRRGSGSAGCSRERALFHVAAVAAARGRRRRSRQRRLLLARRRGGRRPPRLRAHARPSRRPPPLDAAFFTVNGVISVVFFVFVVLATTGT